MKITNIQQYRKFDINLTSKEAKDILKDLENPMICIDKSIITFSEDNIRFRNENTKRFIQYLKELAFSEDKEE